MRMPRVRIATRLRPWVGRWALWCALLSALVLAPPALGQSPEPTIPTDEILEVKVGQVLVEEQIETPGGRQLYQQLEVIVARGPRRGEALTVENGAQPEVNVRRYSVGQRLFVRSYTEPGAPAAYLIDTPSRWLPLLVVFVIFVAAVTLVARWRSITSLAGLLISFAALYVYILPQLAAGAPPVRVALIGGVLIVPLTFYVVHGPTRKTTAAVLGTFIALALTVFLAQALVSLAGLTGYASEEAGFLEALAPGALNIRNLLVAGIIVGVLGVLDDVTISQAAIVEQLFEVNADLSLRELYRRAMQVGQDHIASMVNTLALVYAGASLPLLLLLRTSPLPLAYLLSQETIAEEVIRMVVSSIGLMAAVPITTLLAALWAIYKARWAAPDE